MPVAVSTLESLDAARDVCPVPPARNIDVRAIGGALTEDERSPPRGIHGGVDLTLSKQCLVHGFGGAVPAVLGLRHVVGVGHKGFTSVWTERVCAQRTFGLAMASSAPGMASACAPGAKRNAAASSVAHSERQIRAFNRGSVPDLHVGLVGGRL